MRKILLLAIILSAATFSVLAQGGGKAEPKRISFARGASQTTVKGTLSNGQEMDLVFSAKQGQTVTIRNTKTHLFDLRVYNPDADFETEFDSSPKLIFEVPEDGDYLLYVRKKQVASPRRASFSITLAIK